MKSLAYIPADYRRIKIVTSLAELFNEPFGDASAILCPRSLTEDFNALARRLSSAPSEPGYDRADHSANLAKIAKEQQNNALGKAASAVLSDIRTVAAFMGESRISGTLRVENTGQWRGDHLVEQFHVDFASSPEAGRILCCYTDPVTQWIKSEDARWTGSSTFKAVKGAPIYSFQPGDMFRIKALPHGWSVNQGKPGESCFIHRVPEPTETQKQDIRLLMVMG